MNVLLGGVFASAAIVGLTRPGSGALLTGLATGAAIIAVAFLALAAVMLWSSLVGKMQVCDRLVDALKLEGRESVLDAGCGTGLALIGCAKQLTTGRAVGVDLWAAKDLSNNNAAATLVNATAEGVADRVEVLTGDVTKLQFRDESFDCVASMTVLHNIPTATARDQALREFVRVLKPGGRIAIFDLLHTARYAEVLQGEGLAVQYVDHKRLWLLSGRSLLAEKPRG